MEIKIHLFVWLDQLLIFLNRKSNWQYWAKFCVALKSRIFPINTGFIPIRVTHQINFWSFIPFPYLKVRGFLYYYPHIPINLWVMFLVLNNFHNSFRSAPVCFSIFQLYRVLINVFMLSFINQEKHDFYFFNISFFHSSSCFLTKILQGGILRLRTKRHRCWIMAFSGGGLDLKGFKSTELSMDFY